MCRRWHTLTSRIPLNCYKRTPNPLRSTVNYLRSWQSRCPWHRLTKVLTEMCFILEEHLKCAVGVLAEAIFKSVCCVDGVDSNSRSPASLCLAVSYCLPLRTFSAPPLSHTNTFSGLKSATKFNNKSQASPKKAPPQHSLLHSSGLWSLKQRCSCGTAVRASASSIHFPQLTSLTPPAAAGLTQQQREGIHHLVCDCASLKVVEVNGLAAGLGERSLWRTPHENPAFSASTHDQTPRWCQALPRW